MQALSLIMVLLILAIWLGGAALNFFSARKEKSPRAWVMRIASILMAIGACGFFGAAASALGALNWLPKSFEWPLGFVDGVISAEGFYVAPHTPSGRVQIYDSEWKFIRGWRVDARGGSFKLKTADKGRIEVLTARGKVHYTFDLDGNLLSKDIYPNERYAEFGRDGQTQWVPTPPWLLPFSNPFLAWACAMIGLAMMIALNKQRKARRA